MLLLRASRQSFSGIISPRGWDRSVGHGACSTEYREGREAVMPESGLINDLAECEDPFVLPGG